jgi:hypothetical protein
LNGHGYADRVHLALIKYSVLRLALFVGSLMLLYAIGVRSSLALVFLAGAISLALSYLFLTKPRDDVALALMNGIDSRLARRTGIGHSDADEEDADVAAAEQSAEKQKQKGPAAQDSAAEPQKQPSDSQPDRQ